MCQAVRLNAQPPFLESGTSDDCGRCRAFAAGFGLAPIRPRRTHLYKLLRGLDDEHGEVHLRVVVLGVELADDAQVRLVRSGVDHRARRPSRAGRAHVRRARSLSVFTSWRWGTRDDGGRGGRWGVGSRHRDRSRLDRQAARPGSEASSAACRAVHDPKSASPHRGGAGGA